jgi:epsilon-lactone hydrolase
MPGVGSVDWVVDRRPARLYTRLYVRFMWLARDKAAYEGAANTLERARDRQRDGDRPPTYLTRLLFATTSTSIAGMTVWTLGARRRRRQPGLRVLYLHGGGYVHPLTADYWRLARALGRTGAEVVVPAYPLAPDATVDDVLPRLLALAADAHDSGRPLLVMGDSAGGALAIVLAQQLRDLRRPLPTAVVALCPWLDATLADPEVTRLETTDPMLAKSGLQAAGRWWAGFRGADDPLVSPLHGSLQSLPPIHLVIGDRDILRPAVDGFAERARAANADLRVVEVTAMFHVWMTRAIPEGRRMRRYLRQLVSGYSDSDSDADT